MAADGHLRMTALSRVTLASAGLSCSVLWELAIVLLSAYALIDTS